MNNKNNNFIIMAMILLSFFALSCRAASTLFQGQSVVPTQVAEAAVPTTTSTPIIFVNPMKPTISPTPTITPAVPDNWLNLQQDDFDQNNHAWLDHGTLGNRTSFAEINIKDGRYVWDVNHDESIVFFVCPDAINVTDFLAYVDTQVYGSGNSLSYGLVFHSWYDDYYVFLINRLSEYYVGIYQEGTWEDIIPWTASEAIQPHDTNKVGIKAVDNTYTLTINGETVDTFEDDRIPKGGTCIAVSALERGYYLQTVFDNFELYIPRKSSTQ